METAESGYESVDTQERRWRRFSEPPRLPISGAGGTKNPSRDPPCVPGSGSGTKNPSRDLSCTATFARFAESRASIQAKRRRTRSIWPPAPPDPRAKQVTTRVFRPGSAPWDARGVTTRFFRPFHPWMCSLGGLGKQPRDTLRLLMWPLWFTPPCITLCPQFRPPMVSFRLFVLKKKRGASWPNTMRILSASSRSSVLLSSRGSSSIPCFMFSAKQVIHV